MYQAVPRAGRRSLAELQRTSEIEAAQFSPTAIALASTRTAPSTAGRVPSVNAPTVPPVAAVTVPMLPRMMTVPVGPAPLTGEQLAQVMGVTRQASTNFGATMASAAEQQANLEANRMAALRQAGREAARAARAAEFRAASQGQGTSPAVLGRYGQAVQDARAMAIAEAEQRRAMGLAAVERERSAARSALAQALQDAAVLRAMYGGDSRQFLRGV